MIRKPAKAGFFIGCGADGFNRAAAFPCDFSYAAAGGFGAVPHAATRYAPWHPQARKRMPLSTFLVEDNKTIRDNLIPALEDLVGAQVVGCADSETEAAAWLATHRGEWQLVVVDMFLKEGSGLGVLRTCRQR